MTERRRVRLVKHSSEGRHDNGAVVWAWPLTLLVAAVSTAVLVAGLAFQHTVPEFVPVAGGCGLFVAVVGRLGTAVELRYGDRDLPQPPAPDPVPPGSSKRRRSTGRSSGIAYVAGVLGALLITAGIVGDPADRLGGMFFDGVGAALIAGAALFGPVARFVVTGTQLRIDTAFRRTAVPRRLITGFSPSDLTVRIELIDGDYRDIRVDSPLWDMSRGSEYRHNSRCQVRTMGRITTLMRLVPLADGPSGGVESRRRPGLIAIAVLAAVAIAAMMVIGTVTLFGSPA